MFYMEMDALMEACGDYSASICGFMNKKTRNMWDSISQLEEALNQESINLGECAQILQRIIDTLDELDMISNIISYDKDYNFVRERKAVSESISKIAKKIMFFNSL